MFEILFGWRKASKCKKLIRGVQCRLKLLKNKRSAIVRQLRDDVAQLLKHGHDLSAFHRVEQLFKDESIVAVYDLLDHFCEFIIIHLSYIRKHKDCPNDINEAVSTLIFASARCGDLPELLVIRKLFGERYGKRFATVALELLPGNLVNRQIKENLSIKSVPDDVKYRLVDEIARSCLQPGPLALEYYSELQQEQNNKNTRDQGFNMEAEGKIIHMDYYSSKRKKLLIEPCLSREGHDSCSTSSHCSMALHSSPSSVEWSTDRKEEGRVGSGTHSNSPYEFRILGHKEVSKAAESSSECSSQLPKEMIYLDDIEEFKSPASKGENCPDQRLFMFKSSVVLTTEKLEEGFNGNHIERNESWNEKAASRSSRRRRKVAGKRQRRRSNSLGGRSVKNVESAIYYGPSCDKSLNEKSKSHCRCKHRKKIPLDDTQKPYRENAELGPPGRGRNGMRSFCFGLVHDCSLEDPCYFCTSDEKDDWGNRKMGMTTLEGFSVRDFKEEKVKLGKVKGLDYAQSCASSSLCSLPRETSPWTRKETHHPLYLRALTMPPERPNDCHADNFLRSNSFPFQQPSCLGNGSSTFRHVHPKLPDYDQIAAKFMALKKANLNHKSSQLIQQA
ncbi:hypothetical protein U1Q18_003531 [Sarracenia purpurea var. burkii]